MVTSLLILYDVQFFLMPFAEGGLDYHWDSCLKGYNQINKVNIHTGYIVMIQLLTQYRIDFVKQMGRETVNHMSFFFFVHCCLTPDPIPPLQDELHQLSNSSKADETKVPHDLPMCPGQNFQLSMLLSHLLAARAYTSDVLLQPYLSSWEELVK